MEKIAIYLPIVSAVMWGATYAMYERTLEQVNIPTWLVINGMATIVFAYFLTFFKFPAIDYTVLKDGKTVLLVTAVLLTSLIGYLAILGAIKYVNATYASIGEISYVLFVPIFSFLIYGYRTFSISTLIGGVIVFIGVLIIIRGQYQTMTDSPQVI